MRRSCRVHIQLPPSPTNLPVCNSASQCRGYRRSVRWFGWRIGLHVTYSNSSPSGLDVPVRRACLPSTLSMVEYIHMPKAKLKYTHDGAYGSSCQSLLFAMTDTLCSPGRPDPARRPQQRNVAQYEEEAQQCDEVRRDPHGQQFDEAIPLLQKKKDQRSLRRGTCGCART